MTRFYLLLLTLSCLSFGQASAQVNPQTNLAYRYAPGANVETQQLLYRDSIGEVLELEVRFRFSPAQASPLLRIHAQKGYTAASSRILDTLRQEHLVLRTDSLRRFRYRLPALTDSLLLLEVKLMKPDTAYWFIAERISPYHFGIPQAIPFTQTGLPKLLPYSPRPEDILLAGDSLLYAFYYARDFAPASPPMTALASVDSLLPAPELFVLKQGGPLPRKPGLYFLQTDSSSLVGYSFLRVPDTFPEISTLDRFAGPIRYLATRQEWERLKKANFSKVAIDQFWLNACGEPEIAKSVIRRYYQRIRQANERFTSYKEGWKTDQGMIYTLYGPPTEVYQTAHQQSWHYKKPQYNSEISFTFARARNLFVPEHYVLIRQATYARSYYQIVNAWREGK